MLGRQLFVIPLSVFIHQIPLRSYAFQEMINESNPFLQSLSKKYSSTSSPIQKYCQPHPTSLIQQESFSVREHKVLIAKTTIFQPCVQNYLNLKCLKAGPHTVDLVSTYIISASSIHQTPSGS